jgi:hypothetical protein
LSCARIRLGLPLLPACALTGGGISGGPAAPRGVGHPRRPPRGRLGLASLGTAKREGRLGTDAARPWGRGRPSRGSWRPRHDAQVRAALTRGPCALLVLGGGHDRSSSVRRLSGGATEHVRVTTSHFLLHADTGLKVAQLARLLRLSRPTASRQQGLSSKEAVQAAQHRLAGRPHGKLLPRYAGPLAEFLLTHPDATRYDALDFLQRTWGVRVSTVALHHFLKRYGLDRATRAAARAAAPPPEPTSPLAAPPPPVPSQPALTAVQPGQALPLPAPPFSGHGRSTPAPSC